MGIEINVLIIYEDEDGVRVWSGRKNGYLTPLEWSDLVTRVKVQKFTEERGGKDEREGTD